MCLICAIFMGHDWRTVLVAGTTIGSIIVGTLGILAWMGVSMDPIMMAALIISIGFSVDIPAHVSYHFHSSAYEANAHAHVVHSPSIVAASPSKSPIVVLPLFARLHSTLVSIGPPALQASLSTSLCVLALLFVPLYMAQIFVRIMLSCIFLCVLHSLLLIPALFSLIDLAKSLFTSTDHHK
jgi:multidrug efflux pump subunit AcrB